MKRKAIINEDSDPDNAKSARRVLDFKVPEVSPDSDSTRTTKRRRSTTFKKKAKKIRKSFLEDSYDDITVEDEKEGEGSIGIIEKVCLKNFMCHSNLEFEFGPHVNFIIGNNGSGKSAILSGIMIALGSKSFNTGRAQNLLGYIQRTKQTAYTTVILRNTGPDAYLPNEYGSRIIVERKIFRDGHSYYKLKAGNGKVISDKRGELINIIDALNIQVENPVCILTQEASKCFLDSKDDKKKYELFFKATQLEKLKEQYDKAELKRIQANATLNSKRKAIPDAQIEVDKLEKQVQHIRKLRYQHEEIGVLQTELAWATVIAAENKEAEAKRLVELYTNKIEGFKCKIKEFEEEISSLNGNIAQWRDGDNAMKSEISEFRKKAEADGAASHSISRHINHLKMKLVNLQRHVEAIRVEKRALQGIIDELAKKSQEDLDAEKERRERRLQSLEQIGHELENIRQELTKQLDEQNKQVATNEKHFSTLREHTVNLQTQIDLKKNESNKMKASIRNKECQFGEKIPLLRKKIQDEQYKFDHVPIGPIGLEVTIKDSSWAFAVEKGLSKVLLQSFCCDNQKDSQILAKMMNEIIGPLHSPQIITSKFENQVYNVSQNKVKSNYPTIFDMVTSNNPVIVNCLIDQRNIENILLIEDPLTAQNVMLDCPPGKCSYTYNKLGDQIYPSPNYRYYSCKQKPNGYSLLQQFGPEDIRNVEQEIDRLEQNLKAKVREEQDIKNEIQIMKQHIQQTQAKLVDVRRKILENDYSKKECHPAAINRNDIDTTQIELQSQTQLENKYLLELNEIKKEIKENETECKKKKEESVEALKRVTSTSSIRNAKMSVIEKAVQKSEKLSQDKKSLESRIEKDVASLKATQKELTDASNDLKTVLEYATKLSEKRISTTKSVKEIESKLKELQMVYEEQTKNLNEEEILENFVRKRNQLKDSEIEIRKLIKTIEILKEKIITRQRKFAKIRTAVALRVQYLFLENLQARNFSGELIFDHEESTLTVVANQNTILKSTNGDTSINRKTNTLSGGERSFVTVALLMALSDTSEIPFHILDEYDVFMDNMNRDQSLKMMIEKADEQRNNQFIFLSPLELPPSAFKDTDESIIRIQKMRDPERGEVRPIEETASE